MNNKLLLLLALMINASFAKPEIELHLNTYEPTKNISREKFYEYIDEEDFVGQEDFQKELTEEEKTVNDKKIEKEVLKEDKQKEAGKEITNAKDLGIEYPIFFEELIGISPDNYSKEFLIAKPYDKKEVYYFDANGQYSEKATENGFYREVLGENEDGLIIAQDFYQDTKTAQVAPFLMIENGNLKDFSANQNQGLLVWFDKEQKFSSALIKDNKGNNLTPQAFYKDDKLIVQAKEDDKDEGVLVFYYPDGKNIMASLHSKEELFTFFRTDGTLFAKAGFGANKNVKFWNQSGIEIPMDENNSQSLEILFKQVLEKIEMIK